MDTEEKKVGLAWEQKSRQITNSLGYLWQLEEIDKAFMANEEALSEVGLGIGYTSMLEDMYKVMESLDTLWSYVYALRGYVDVKIDTPLYKAFVNKATEGLSRIRLEDFEVDVSGTNIDVSQRVDRHEVDYSYSTTERKTKLSFADFLGSEIGMSVINGRTSRTTLNSVNGFSEVFTSQYEFMKENLEDEEGNQLSHLEYLEMLETMGEFTHNMDKPALSFLSGLLDITIVKPLIEACTGEDMITGEDLSDTDKILKVAFAVLDLVTLGKAMLATGITKLGAKETIKQLGRVAVIELGTNAAGYTVNAAGEQLKLPTWMTLLLSIGGAAATNQLLEKKLLKSQHIKINYKNEGGSKTISQADRIKIDGWDYTPNDELYLKYKDVFDNPKYYNQETGAINWPENNGFAGTPIDEVLQPGTRIDRYGSDYGSFTSPEGIPYEMRAVAPGTDQRPYSVFEVVEPINVKSGSIAPWFDEPGGGIQYLLPDTVDELLDAGILRRIQ